MAVDDGAFERLSTTVARHDVRLSLIEKEQLVAKERSTDQQTALEHVSDRIDKLFYVALGSLLAVIGSSIVSALVGLSHH